MKVVVLGAAGRMAPGVIRDLAEGPEVKRIVLIDWDWTRNLLEERAAEWGQGKAQVKTLAPDNLARLQSLIRNSHVLANCMTHRYNLPIMDACLAAGVHYVDLGGLYYTTCRQLELSNQWRETDLTAVVGMGSAPGIVNVMSRLAVDMLDTVDSIHIREGLVNHSPGESPLPIPYALETILDQFILPSYVFEAGELRQVPPFYGEESVDFPEPVGRQTACCTLHSEMATIPGTFHPKGLKYMTFKKALPKSFKEKMRFLVDLGLGGTHPLSVGKAKVVPRDFLNAITQTLPYGGQPFDDHQVLRVDVAGVKEGMSKNIRVEMSCHPYQPWGMATNVHSVGVPVGVTCRLIGSGVITTRGALPAEACIPPHPFFQELAQRGLPSTVSVTHPIN